MFTLEAIALAHAQVKSGADFPKYIQDLIKLGITSYDTFVEDGRTCYSGVNEFMLNAEAKYPKMAIATKSRALLFKTYLKMHQNGETDYPTFCKHAAECGVQKWQVKLQELRCTYFDTVGAIMIEENINA